MARLVLLVASLVVPSAARAQDLATDHVFIVVATGAPEARALEQGGFRLSGDTARHRGQGTASVFFMFDNAYLELLWIDDPDELADADPALATRLAGAENAGASPFGLGLRRIDHGEGNLPFPARSYSADWMRPGSAIRMAEDQPLREPVVFVVPEYMSWPKIRGQRPIGDQLNHPNGAKRITSVRVGGPGVTVRSAAIGYLEAHGVVEAAESADHVLELEFDGGRAGQTLDVRPTLPLVVHY